MRKLIYALDGAFLGEFPIDRARMTIGRRPGNDIHIDNLSISGEHAAIVTTGDAVFIEDLGSTNGTVVNGQPVGKHVLRHGDLIELGKYQLRYADIDTLKALATIAPEVAGKTGGIPPAPATPTSTPKKMSAVSLPAAVPDQPSARERSAPGMAAPGMAAPAARMCFKDGPEAGRELALTKVLTTLGRHGSQLAVVTRRPHGYFISHIEGVRHPVVNGSPIGLQAHALADHDVIEVGGVVMTFHCDAA